MLFMADTAKNVIFKGRVQGVGFRWTVHRIAARYNVTGFVRNLPDGTVEMLAQGDVKDIQGCLDEIADSFSGYIRNTQINNVAPDNKYTDFRITF
jgi:acylphosphatase